MHQMQQAVWAMANGGSRSEVGSGNPSAGREGMNGGQEYTQAQHDGLVRKIWSTGSTGQSAPAKAAAASRR